jgi:hypothetical protein
VESTPVPIVANLNKDVLSSSVKFRKNWLENVHGSLHRCCMSLCEQIAQALRRAGHRTLDDQTRALGLCRSTTWTIVSSQHKLGRLSHKVRARMLANPNLPLGVRKVLEAHRSTEFSHKKNLKILKASGERKHSVLRGPKTSA